MTRPASQRELHAPSPLLDPYGRLVQVGWSRQPLLDCNLEQARFYRLRPLQRFRIKRWDYYAVTTPTHFVSATLADLGYAGQVFAYVIDFAARQVREHTLTIPLGRGISLPRNSHAGESLYDDGRVRMRLAPEADCRRVQVEWPGFDGGRGLQADLTLQMPPEHESMTIVIPIGDRRFYYNRKVNGLPAEGQVVYDGRPIPVRPDQALGTLDWGRGVWEYRSFWVWASASGFLPDRRRIGLNFGFGFGDTRAATENAVILDGRVHKLGRVAIDYDAGDFMRPWRMHDEDGRLALEFTPFLDRTARTNLLLIASEVHQMFGRYRGTARTDEGESLQIDGLIGWAEEHRARW